MSPPNRSSKNNASWDQWVALTPAIPGYHFSCGADYANASYSLELGDLLKRTGMSATVPLDAAFGQENRNELMLAITKAQKRGFANFEVKLRPYDEPPVYLYFTIYYNASSERAAFTGYGQDFSDFKHRESTALTTLHDLEQKLEERTKDLALARDRAMAASRAKSGFLANMSHELRTPLNAIIGYSEILIEDMNNTGNDHSVADIKKIHNAGKHLLSLINDILDLSKIEAGKMGLNLEYFRVDTMLKEAIDTILPLAVKNNTRVENAKTQDLGVMLSDVTKIRQIIFNLLSNAIKFTENGTVTIQPSREKIDGKEHFKLIVRDTGIGMSHEEVTKLFQEFFQAENDVVKKWSGTGLGLVISQRFAQMMGGEIKVDSELGKGTTFIVTIPVNTAKIRFQDSPDGFTVGPKIDPRLVRFSGDPSITEKRRTISRVLVIDDDPNVRDLMERYLSREGFEVRSVGNGQEGIDVIQEFKPDVITLDVLMPVMDGWSVLTELKKRPETSDIPVIMLSMMDELDMSFALGAADYLMKPIQKDVLVKTVLRHLRDNENGRVLVVDDQEENRRLIVQVLHRHGIGTYEAENGIEAIKVMEKHMPNLILLDLMMPEMDGFRFSEEVKKRVDWKDVPIVVLTARDLSDEDLKRLSGNVEKVFERKTLNLEDFLIEIQSVVTRTVRSISNKE